MNAFRIVLPILLAAAVASSQTRPEPKPKPEPKPEEEGIPVRSALVREKCIACHAADDKGRLTRISFRRATPEGWQQTIRRMVALNDVPLTPDEARAIVRYLADRHGVAPDEARPANFEVERRTIDFKYTADKDTEKTCTACHSMGRVLTERRTKEEWELLIAMHRGYYPLSDFQAFRRTGLPRREPGEDGRPPDNRHPMEKAVEHLSKTFPLRTPEWAAWAATMRPPQLEGRWALSGYQPGKGPIFGEVTIRKAPPAGRGPSNDGGQAAPRAESDAAAEFSTDIRYASARSGEVVTRQGTAIVYTGFQWRGRSTPPAASAAGAPASAAWREVLLVERDWRRMSGRWFTGGYDELGADVTLVRIGSDPVLLGLSQPMVKRGSRGHQMRLLGANFPAALAAADVDLGPGVEVRKIVSVRPDAADVEVDVAADAPIGTRDAFLAGSSAPSALAVYDKIDAIKVSPQAGLARIGGLTFPKQLQQFEALAYSNGPDGKPDTKDDVTLGIVDASWSLEEFTATFDDDDTRFVGTIDRAGLFTPNVEGPNPERRNNANNYGDVWVVASYTPADAGARPLRARAHLLVTVPLYIRFDAPERAR